jgi:hypothetical protein
MFLVKLLGKPQWTNDGYTARNAAPVRVRVCDHVANSAHPQVGEEFCAARGELVAVQYGSGNL